MQAIEKDNCYFGHWIHERGRRCLASHFYSSGSLKVKARAISLPCTHSAQKARGKSRCSPPPSPPRACTYSAFWHLHWTYLSDACKMVPPEQILSVSRASTEVVVQCLGCAHLWVGDRDAAWGPAGLLWEAGLTAVPSHVSLGMRVLSNQQSQKLLSFSP